MAFTLIDAETGRAVRVSLKPDFFEMALGSPFVKKREAGVKPQDIEPEITDPMVERIKGLPESAFLNIGEVHTVEFKKGKGLFKTKRCENCGEVTFINKLRINPEGKTVCIPCSNYRD